MCFNANINKYPLVCNVYIIPKVRFTKFLISLRKAISFYVAICFYVYNLIKLFIYLKFCISFVMKRIQTLNKYSVA